MDEVVLRSVWNRIDREEVAELALQLGKFTSSTTEELPVADFLSGWLSDNGFEPKRVGLIPERPNLMAVMRGSGSGPSLAFNSHMDIFWQAGDPRYRDPNAAIYRTAWREGDLLHGAGVVNDKGPMACWLIAARALLQEGVKLRGDVVLTIVSGEIGHEPVDEFQGLKYSGKDLGTAYMVTHGGAADYALVAEATNFSLGWVEAGKAFFKIRIFGGPSLYTPFLKDRENPSAILKAARLLSNWDDWAADYTARHRYECEGGTVQPRASVGAIRGGLPYALTRTTEVCELYVDLRTSPGQSPTKTRQELVDLLESLKLDGDVSLFLHRPGREAQGIEPLANAVRAAHRQVFGNPPTAPTPPSTSMWRDTNPFIGAGIPAAMYGPTAGAGGGTFVVAVEDLYKASLVYAGTALELCG